MDTVTWLTDKKFYLFRQSLAPRGFVGITPLGLEKFCQSTKTVTPMSGFYPDPPFINQEGSLWRLRELDKKFVLNFKFAETKHYDTVI
jgi:hypothetical protein